MNVLIPARLWREKGLKGNISPHRISARETELDIEVARVTMEWRNTVSPLREWINVVLKTVDDDNDSDVDVDSLKNKKHAVEVCDSGYDCVLFNIRSGYHDVNRIYRSSK